MVGDEALVMQLLRMFYEDTQDTVKELTAELERKDYVAAQKRVHALKGSAATLGATELRQAAELLDMDLRNSYIDPVNCEWFAVLLEKNRSILAKILNKLN